MPKKKDKRPVDKKMPKVKSNMRNHIKLYGFVLTLIILLWLIRVIININDMTLTRFINEFIITILVSHGALFIGYILSQWEHITEIDSDEPFLIKISMFILFVLGLVGTGYYVYAIKQTDILAISASSIWMAYAGSKMVQSKYL